MNLLKEKIIERLEALPDIELSQVLDFVDFLTRSRHEISEQPKNKEDATWLEGDLSGLGCYEAYDWQEGEVEEGFSSSKISW
jgi:hypothetical protein